MSKGKEMKFTDLLKRVIVEQSRMDVLADKLTKADKGKKPLLTPEELFALVVADPQTKIQDGIDIDNFGGDFTKVKKVGPYAQWIIKTYLNQKPKVEDGQEFDMTDKRNQEIVRQMKSQFMEDLYKVTGDLQKFDRHKGKIPAEFRDINKLTPSKLYDLVKDFSLEKTKASAQEKQEAAKTFVHPGADLIYNGPNWVVTKITDTGKLGKDAACFFGGYGEETRWCTSSPGLQWFERYIGRGPLYQVFKKSSTATGKTGLPKERYQFHFQDNQFMDIDDRQIDLVSFLNNKAPEIKELFKHEFAKGLTKDNKGGKELTIDYPRDASSKYVALYGWDDLFNSMDKDIERIDFTNSSREPLTLNFPSSLADFKNLQTFYVENAVDKVPEELKGLQNIEFLSFPNNPKLSELPEWIADFPKLMALSVKGSNPSLKVPERLQKRFAQNGGDVWFVGND